ncbi:lectin-like protein [Fluviicola sp.]|uniref:lectin-like protein n=1 Tax=Fluviicola sp. TaxID=1917219 RepID=UPI0031D3FF44
MKTIYPLLIALGICSVHSANAQCTLDSFLIRPFEFNGSNYEIVLETRNWQDAATCAVSRGGKLVEINSQAEQDAVFMEINNVFFDHSQTVAPDGGGASYLWLGGNDASSEGNWVWNGDNDAQTSPFWIGTSNGTPVNGSYENWGNEPDNWNNQDGLAIAVTDWPLGQSGQWNDVFLSNQLYFIIEYPPSSLGIAEEAISTAAIWPNPANRQVTISFRENDGIFRIADLSGKTLLTGETTSGVSIVDLSAFASGTYLVYAGPEIIKLVIE